MLSACHRPLNRAFEPGKAEMRFARTDQRPGQRYGSLIPFFRQFFDRRAAGIAEIEQFGGLVEGFARSVVNGRGKPPIIADPAHLQKLAMAAAGKQQQIGEIEMGVGKARREGVAFKMIDRNQRLAGREREPLAHEQPDHHPADEARTRSGRNRIDFRSFHFGFIQYLTDKTGQYFDMGAGGDFRHHPAKWAMAISLADHGLRQNLPIRRDQCRRAIVAGGFESENKRHGAPLPQRCEKRQPAPWGLPCACRCGTGRAMARTIKLGTRGSPLALAQAEMVKAALCAAHRWGPEQVEIVTLKTGGDRVQDRPLAEIGGKAIWTKELDRALLAGETDISVHSMKDVESERVAGLGIAAMLPRADVRDRLIGADSIEALREGAIIGTSSPRRAAQLKALRPDLKIVTLRGNVATRMAKCETGEVDATLLAAAGLDRLGLENIGAAIPIDVMLPAAAQGAVGIDARAVDAEMQEFLAAIDHPDTHDAILAERAFVAALTADCHSPLAALATVTGDQIRLQGELLNEEGSERISGEVILRRGDLDSAAALARSLLSRASAATRSLFGA